MASESSPSLSSSSSSSSSSSFLPPNIVEVVLPKGTAEVVEISSFPGRSGDDATPVIFLLGWYISRAKHVRKYASLYHEAGYETVQLTSLSPDFVLNSLEYARRIKEAFLTLEDKRRKEGKTQIPKIIVHSFSNGGLKHFCEWIRLVEEDPEMGKWKGSLLGVVLDSSPTRMTPSSFSGAMTGHLPPGITKTVQGSLVYTLGLGLGAYYYLAGRDPHSSLGIPLLFQQDAWQTQVPYLYIYSPDDVITDWTFVEECAERQRQMGVKVSTLKLDGSSHVAHLMTHREEYRRAVLQFLQEAGVGLPSK